MAQKEIKLGFVVLANSAKYRVIQFIDSETIIARKFDNGLSEKLKINDVIILNQEEIHENEMVPVTDSAWQKAQSKFLIIKPLIDLKVRTTKDVEDRANEVGVHSATLYRWIRKYEKTGKPSALLPTRRTGGKGRSRLNDVVENILVDVIENFHIQSDKPHIPKTIKRVISACKAEGLRPPGVNTIRARINSVTEKQKLKCAQEKKNVTKNLDPFPGIRSVKYPLSVIQIDHAPLNLTIVDEFNKLSYGRPWITLAIDVFTRMVAGFYISLDKPSDLSIGLCITHMVLPKNIRIAELDLHCSWPIMGIPSRIQVDSPKEVDGRMLERTCNQHRIDIQFNPLNKPNYGAHIDRYLGDLFNEIRNLPGTTNFHVAKRAESPSEGNTAFTLVEVERRITQLFCENYHKRLHSEIHDSPEAKYLYCLRGDKERLGIGRPRLPNDPDKFTLDFLPFIERTVQHHGIRINKINYYHDILKAWVGAKDSVNNKRKRTFIVRYDPRDISKIFFFDPELERYFEIPYRNISAPRMTLWELRETQKSMKLNGLKNYGENTIFSEFLRLHDTVVQNNTTGQTEFIDNLEEELEPFDDIEVGL